MYPRHGRRAAPRGPTGPAAVEVAATLSGADGGSVVVRQDGSAVARYRDGRVAVLVEPEAGPLGFRLAAFFSRAAGGGQACPQRTL